jgi:hypothetical protein
MVATLVRLAAGVSAFPVGTEEDVVVALAVAVGDVVVATPVAGDEAVVVVPLIVVVDEVPDEVFPPPPR